MMTVDDILNKGGIISIHSHRHILGAEVCRLRKENERLRKDAERYQWLRDSDYDLGKLFQHIQSHGLTQTGIDAAIDAARGAK